MKRCSFLAPMVMASLIAALASAIPTGKVNCDFCFNDTLKEMYFTDVTDFVLTTQRPTLPSLHSLNCEGEESEVTLYVRVARINTVGGVFNYSARVYCTSTSLDDCHYPGPHIHMHPGKPCHIRLVNLMVPEARQEEKMDSMHYPNVVNLHTHGLHVSPAEDNVIVSVPEGTYKNYSYHLPASHVPGLNWYHAHFHGASALHVMGGVVGPLTVVPGPNFKLPQLYQDMMNHTLVLTHVMVCDGLYPTTDRPFHMKGYCSLMKWTKDSAVNQTMGAMLLLSPSSGKGATPSVKSVSDFYFTNGAFQPSLQIAPNKFHRFDIVNAVADRYIHLQLYHLLPEYSSTCGNGRCVCEMILMALDGVFLVEPRNISSYGVILHPGARASLAVRCPSELLGSHPNNTVHLVSCGANTKNISGDLIYNTTFLSLLLAEEGGVPGRRSSTNNTHEHATVVVPNTLWGSSEMQPRPYHLRDLGNQRPDSHWDVSVGLPATIDTRDDGLFPEEDWLGVGSNCTGGYENANNTHDTCAYRAFGCPGNVVGGSKTQTACPVLGKETIAFKALKNFPYRHVAQNCDVEQISILHGDTRPHPLHFHTFHLQVQSVQDEHGAPVENFKEWGEVGDFRDTIPTFHANITARYRLARWSSLYMYHCHFLVHEDFGMMDRFWVNPQGKGSRCTGPNCDAAIHIDPSDKDAAFWDNYSATSGLCPGQEPGNATPEPSKFTPLVIGLCILGGVLVLIGVCCCLVKRGK